MILYNKSMGEGMRSRPSKTVSISFDTTERPQRLVPMIRNNRERVKYIKSVEQVIRSSMEYRDYMTFLKNNMDMRRCTVLRGLNTENNKKYTIEIHHEPFTLFDIVETVMNAYDLEGTPLTTLRLAEDVMAMHYDEIVGLIPLSKTVHELIHADQIFIPLQYIYHKYDKFYEQYEHAISPNTKEKIEAKVACSMKCGDILSDSIDPEFTYMDIDGFAFPKVPDEWKDLLSVDKSAQIPKEEKKKPDQELTDPIDDFDDIL